MRPTDYHPAYFQVRFRCPGSPLDWPDSFAIITALATTGEIWGAEENQAADAQLAARLQNAGCWHRRITGYSPLDGHAEEGWAALLPLELSRALGREFRQDAIYWISGDQCWVTKCVAESELVPVGSFRERLDAGRAGE